MALGYFHAQTLGVEGNPAVGSVDHDDDARVGVEGRVLAQVADLEVGREGAHGQAATGPAAEPVVEAGSSRRSRRAAKS